MARKIAFRATGSMMSALLIGIYGDLLAVSTHALKLDDTVDQREQGIILAATDVVARMDLRAVLAENNVAGLDVFAAELFAAKPLAIRIPAVS